MRLPLAFLAIPLLAANPDDLIFQISTPHSAYRIGERIPLLLSFSSTTPNKYKLNAGGYDRSGRLPTEEFTIEPANVVDPYRDYLATGVLGAIAGGLRTYPTLDAKPIIISLILNDWFRFDQPGTYRVHLKSHRIEQLGDSPFAPDSNTLEIKILPADPNLDAAKLLEIRAILESSKPDSLGHLSPEAQGAVLDLRYLSTTDAIGLAFEFARSQDRLPDPLTLSAARDRSRMLAEFDRYLADPDLSFATWDIRLRALFSFVAKTSPAPLPLYPWQLPANSDWKSLQAVAEARQAYFELFVQDAALALIPATLRKNEAFRKRSAEAIGEVIPKAARSAGLIPPEDYGLTRPELISQFAGFFEDQQYELLTRKWDLVRGPEMIPNLRHLIAAAPANPLPKAAIGLELWGAPDGLHGTALRRLQQLDPAAAEDILRADLALESPRFASFAVHEWPARDIPEATENFAKLLETNRSGALPLLARFGTAAFLPAMRTTYDDAALPCDQEVLYLAYFLRVEPKYGASVLRQAMARRERRGCFHTTLSRISRVIWSGALLSQALTTLNDPDPEAALDAAGVLSAHAGANVEPLLWKRLEESETWRGRSPAEWDERLGSTLAESIASAKSWILDEPRRQRLLFLCVDESCRGRWSHPLTQPIRIVAVYGGGAYPSAFRVQSYSAPDLPALQAKLQQFPRDTRFAWCPQESGPFNSFTPGDQNEMFHTLLLFLAPLGMAIETCPAAP